jgi:hypothetical protein
MPSKEFVTEGRRPWVVLAAIAGFVAGSVVQHVPFVALATARADGHGAQADPAAKAPLAEVMHCPLAFEGTHLLKEMPEVAQVAYHYCKPMGDNLAQCLLYDGTGPDARLIGVEYLVPDNVFRSMPPDEQVYWHDHKYEVDAGLLKSLIQTGEEEKATLAKVRTLYGKIFHTWSTGKTYPRGPARLFWAVTGEEPFVFPREAQSAPAKPTNR